jgi:hypothetical protein
MSIGKLTSSFLSMPSDFIRNTQIAADRGEDRNIIRSLLRAEAMELVEDAKMVQDASGGVLDLPTAIYMLERRAPNAPAIPAPAAAPAEEVEDEESPEDEAEDIAEDEAEAGSTD